MKTKMDIIVIGGGAAGMTAAWKAASEGASVTLLEKNAKLGIKILISGGGKCNITHGGDITTMLRQFQSKESRFLKYAFHTFSNRDIVQVLNDGGIETYERDNGKIFPVSHKAGDVVHAFRRLMEKYLVDIRINSPVYDIAKNDDGNFTVSTLNETFHSHSVIIAVGGNSFKKTGTTGDGYAWAQKFGHTIVPIRPALTPIVLQPTPPQLWQGTPIRDCVLKSVHNGAVIAQWHGDALFTHFGISGPAALEISRDTFLAFERGNHVSLYVDFFPESTMEQLEQNTLKNIELQVAKNILSLIEQLVPQRLAEHILSQSGISTNKKLHQLSKQERRSLVATLKHCSIGSINGIPLDSGEVTAGGVSLHEITQTTMESKLVSGLFFCGEILDVAGPIGGYNLQAAFSTGFVAGKSSAGVVTALAS